MAEITPVYSTTIADLKANISKLSSHPMGVMRASLQHLSEVSSGAVNIVDASTPWAFLMELSAVAVSSAIDEMTNGFRSLYPKLAMTESDLYKHMSDKDYLNRFSQPAIVDFYITLSLEDIQTKMNEYPVTMSNGSGGVITYIHRDFIIPRSSSIKIGEYSFVFEHSIILRTIHKSTDSSTDGDNIRQQLTIFYDSTVPSPIQKLKTNTIDYEVRVDGDGKKWIYFITPLIQAQLTKVTEVITSSSFFQKDISFTDKFYFARAFYKNQNTNNTWREFNITHNQEVFDSTTPTLLVQKQNNELKFSLPLVYTSLGTVVGDIKILVYTTKGYVNMDMSTYLVGDYVTTLTDHYSAYSDYPDSMDYKSFKAMAKSNFLCYSTQRVASGSDALDFDQLRYGVIYDTLGDRKLPITDIELTTNQVTRDGFEIIKNIDTVTNRAFLAIKKMPKPLTTDVITSANIGIAPVIFQTLTSGYGHDRFALNGDRITLMSETVFSDQNGVLTLLTADTLYNNFNGFSNKDIINTINNNQYLYNPFYYVLDAAGEEFSSRAYDLDHPKMDVLSFEQADVKFDVNVATDSYAITKVKDGYKLHFVTKSTTLYHDLIALASSEMAEDSEIVDVMDQYIQMQVSIYDAAGKTWVYYKATPIEIIGDQEPELKFEVHIKTNYDLDSSSRLCITNSNQNTLTNDVKAYVDLTSKIRIIHLVQPSASAGAASLLGYVNTSILGDGESLVPVSLQTIQTTFGHYLKNLWSRSRSYVTDAIYARYPSNVYLTYPEDVYELNPNTGSRLYVEGGLLKSMPLLHAKNSQVLDDNGAPIVLHNAGDIIIDSSGNLTEIQEPQRSTIGLKRELDILLVDAKYLFATYSSTVAYRTEISNTLVSWITQNIQRIQDILINQTRVYFYPKTTLSTVSAWVDDTKDTVIQAEQSLRVDLYVTSRLYDSESLQREIKRTITSILDKFIDQSYISISDIVPLIKQIYPQEIKGIKLYGLGGSSDYQVLYLKQDYNRLCLKKRIEENPDGTLEVNEDVSVTFFNVDRILAK